MYDSETCFSCGAVPTEPLHKTSAVQVQNALRPQIYPNTKLSIRLGSIRLPSTIPLTTGFKTNFLKRKNGPWWVSNDLPLDFRRLVKR